MIKILCSSFILFLTFESIKSQRCATPKISQLIPSAPTPISKNFEINVGLIAPFAQYLKDNGILDVLVAGYVGGGASFNLCDRKALVQAWVDAAGPLGIGVLVQIGLLPFVDVLELARFCAELNVKALVVVPEVIFKPQTVNEAIADLKLIADVAGIPIIYEDIPAAQSVVSPVDIYIKAVAEIPCFAGLLTSLNVAFNVKAVASVADKLLCIAGQETIGATLSLHLNASISAAISLFPLEALNIKAAVDEGNRELVEARQNEMNEKIAVVINLDGNEIDVFSRDYITNQKVAFSLKTGLDFARTSPPLEPACPEVVNQIADGLRSLFVILRGTVEGVVSSLA